MSLFLGKIHYWLFKKITWFENLEEKILEFAGKNGFNTDEIKEDIYSRFGRPTEKKPLEEIIDTTNIHGWLQGRINSAEARQAALITLIINKDSEYKKELVELFKTQGESAGNEYKSASIPNSPIEMYNALNEYILEGMSCDRVNEVTENNENEIVWETTQCLHSVHYEAEGGDVNNFYDLREEWIKAFVKSLNNAFIFEKLRSNTQRIKRV